jgi:hypothetical protein
MSDQALLALMADFRRAYATADEEKLKSVTTDDFEWHQHVAENIDGRPTGRVLKGIDALVAEVKWRQQHWQDTQYENLVERAAGDMLVQTFTIRGKDENQQEFFANAVDLYPVRDNLIYRKDTYWKYVR